MNQLNKWQLEYIMSGLRLLCGTVQDLGDPNLTLVVDNIKQVLGNMLDIYETIPAVADSC